MDGWTVGNTRRFLVAQSLQLFFFYSKPSYANSHIFHLARMRKKKLQCDLLQFLKVNWILEVKVLQKLEKHNQSIRPAIDGSLTGIMGVFV